MEKEKKEVGDIKSNGEAQNNSKTKAKPVSIEKSIKEKLKKYREKKKAPMEENVWREDFISLGNTDKKTQKLKEADILDAQETNQEVITF